MLGFKNSSVIFVLYLGVCAKSCNSREKRDESRALWRVNKVRYRQSFFKELTDSKVTFEKKSCENVWVSKIQMHFFLLHWNLCAKNCNSREKRDESRALWRDIKVRYRQSFFKELTDAKITFEKFCENVRFQKSKCNAESPN